MIKSIINLFHELVLLIILILRKKRKPDRKTENLLFCYVFILINELISYNCFFVNPWLSNLGLKTKFLDLNWIFLRKVTKKKLIDFGTYFIDQNHYNDSLKL
jgi:hypothetical protein